jgi:hypothetical protein
VAVILAWAWQPTRFLVPLLPLLMWYGWRRVEGRKALAASIALVAVCLAGVSLAHSSKRTLELGDPMPLLGSHDSWWKLEQLLGEARERTSKGAILAGNLDPLYYLFTGRKAVRGFEIEPYALLYAPSGEAIGSTEAMLSSLDRFGVTHWIHTPNSTYAEGKHLGQIQKDLARENPEAVTLIPTRGDPTHSLYELRRADAGLIRRAHNRPRAAADKRNADPRPENRR